MKRYFLLRIKAGVKTFSMTTGTLHGNHFNRSEVIKIVATQYRCPESTVDIQSIYEFNNENDYLDFIRE